jgi:hypothetical protein
VRVAALGPFAGRPTSRAIWRDQAMADEHLNADAALYSSGVGRLAELGGM